MSDGFFEKALNSFTMNAACDDAIRHLTDRGFTPVQIRDALTFPAPMERIVSIMWNRLIDKHMILLTDPASALIRSGSSEIVEHRDAYGRKSFLSVKKESSEEMIFSPEDYIMFDQSGQSAEISSDFTEYLPWPHHPVWVHVSLFQGQESSS
ncbi:MAG: hypothetical protein K6F73_05640 [Lachnospiraceae bacterium]|nr:hypothetical protein [Lachnospiraceae bacterium]